MEFGEDKIHETAASEDDDKKRQARDVAICRKVLLMVSEFHVRGFQRLRIAPGESPSGCSWRCAITPVTNISSSHGARLVDWDHLPAHCGSGELDAYFGWSHCRHLAPSRLAERFRTSFPDIVEAGRGRDWMYVGWYQEMLNLTYPDVLPVAYSDGDDREDCLITAGCRRGVTVPLPPVGEGRPETS
jgi:hypothetical protein